LERAFYEENIYYVIQIDYDQLITKKNIKKCFKIVLIVIYILHF